MTTATLRQPGFRIPPWVWLGLIILLAALAIPPMIQSAHASLHAEAEAIRCAAKDSNNILGVWANSSGERLNCLLKLPDGRVGDLVMQWCKKSGWIEVTAYVFSDGLLSDTIKMLKAKGCQKVFPLD